MIKEGIRLSKTRKMEKSQRTNNQDKVKNIPKNKAKQANTEYWQIVSRLRDLLSNLHQNHTSEVETDIKTCQNKMQTFIQRKVKGVHLQK